MVILKPADCLSQVCRSTYLSSFLFAFLRRTQPTVRPALPSSWANLRALQRLVAKEEMELEVNVRERQVSGMKTIQLETCGASAIQHFDKVCTRNVVANCYFEICEQAAGEE